MTEARKPEQEKCCRTILLDVKLLYILEAFWQHEIDIKRAFEVRIVTK